MVILHWVKVVICMSYKKSPLFTLVVHRIGDVSLQNDYSWGNDFGFTMKMPTYVQHFHNSSHSTGTCTTFAHMLSFSKWSIITATNVAILHGNRPCVLHVDNAYPVQLWQESHQSFRSTPPPVNCKMFIQSNESMYGLLFWVLDIFR